MDKADFKGESYGWCINLGCFSTSNRFSGKSSVVDLLLVANVIGPAVRPARSASLNDRKFDAS